MCQFLLIKKENLIKRGSNHSKTLQTFTFETDGGFLLDSAKQRYSGRYEVIGDEVELHFNTVPITELRTNKDPNQQGGYAVSTNQVNCLIVF